MVRRLLRALLVILAAVVVLAVAAIVTLETSWAKERVRRLAVDRAAPYLTGKLAIGRLDGSLFRGVELHDVALTQPTGEAVRAKSITVRYDPVRLWRNGLSFDAIEIRSPVVHVVQEADGGWNLARLVRTREPSGRRTTFRIDAITLADAAVIVDTLKAEPRRLTDVNLKGALVYHDGDFRMTVDELTGRDDRSGFVMDEFAGSFGQGFRRIDATFKGHAGASRLSGRVTGDGSAAGRQLNVVTNLDGLNLAPVLENARFASDITGRAELDIAIPATKGAESVLKFRFQGPRASAFGYAGEDIDVTGTFGSSNVTFAGRARAYGARATIDAAWQFSAPAGGHTGFAGTGTFAGANLTRLPQRLSIPPLDSNLAGKFNIRMTNGDWTAAVTLRPSTVEGAKLADGTTGWMEIGRGAVRYTAQGIIEGLDVQRLSKPLKIPLLAEPRFRGALMGSFQAAGESAGRARRLLKADAALHDSSLGGTTFPQMDVHVELENTRLLVHARGGFDGLTGELAGLSDKVPMDLDGTTDATAVFHEVGAPLSVETVDVSGQVRLGPSTVRGVALSFASVDGEMSNGVLTLTTASVEGPSIRASASGTAALGSTGESALKVEANSDDLRPIGDLIGRPITGAADLSAEVTGPSSKPHATGSLNGRSIAYGDTATALTLNTSFVADMPNRDVAALTVNAKTESAFLKAGGVEFIRASVSSDWAHNELVVDSQFEEKQRTLGLTGVLAMQEGASRQVTLRRLDVATGDAIWAMPAGREARIDFGGEQLSIDGLVLARDVQQVSVAGRLPFEGSSSTTGLDVDVVNVQLADVNRLLLGTRRLEGVVSGEATIRGSLKTPAADATLTIAKGAVEGVAFDGVRADVQYAEGLAKVNAALTQSPGAELTVVGTVPVAAPATDEDAGMDLQVKSSPISLGLAQAFTSELTAISGTGTFDMHVTGTAKAPVLDGNVAIDAGAFTVVGTGVAYRDLLARLQFNQNRLQIGDFSIADKNGRTLRVAGGVDLVTAGTPTTFDVTFMTDGFAVLDNELGSIRVDALVTAKGDFASPTLSGNIRVADGRLEVDRILELTSNDLYSTTPLEPGDDAAVPPIEGAGDVISKAVNTAANPATAEGSSNGLLSRVDLNLHVRLPDNFVMRGRDLRTGRSSIGLGDMNIVAGGDLTVRKGMNGPANVVGNLQILRGYYSFQGRRFDVRPESSVRFRGVTPIDPALDVTADRLVSGVIASVEVQGTMREPEIQLSSQPPLDDADLLALIIFGQPVNDLGTSQRASLSERAATLAAGAIAAPIADSVARALNLDLFEIQSAGEAATVSLGTQIGSRLYVGVRQQVGRGDTSALSIEYRIASYLRLVTSIVHGAMDAHASERFEQSGADLIFSWRH